MDLIAALIKVIEKLEQTGTRAQNRPSEDEIFICLFMHAYYVINIKAVFFI